MVYNKAPLVTGELSAARLTDGGTSFHGLTLSSLRRSPSLPLEAAKRPQTKDS